MIGVVPVIGFRALIARRERMVGTGVPEGREPCSWGSRKSVDGDATK